MGRIKSYSIFEQVLWSGMTTPPPHWVAIPHLLQEKQHPETHVNFWCRSNIESKVMALSNRYSGLKRRHLRLTKYRFHIYYKENSCLRCRIHASPVAGVRWWYRSPKRLYGLSNPCVTRASNFVDEIWVAMGCLGCWINASLVPVVWLMISESLGAVWAVESMCHLCQQFVDDIWVPRGCLRYRIHASPVPGVRWWYLSP
jgi:hypothetical protein